VESLFNKNVIKPGDNKEYIKEAVDAIVILRAKQGYNCKDDVLAYLKVSLNQITKIKPTKVIKLLRS
jgi:NifU-like protein involved in Fe-S cluster formation